MVHRNHIVLKERPAEGGGTQYRMGIDTCAIFTVSAEGDADEKRLHDILGHAQAEYARGLLEAPPSDMEEEDDEFVPGSSEAELETAMKITPEEPVEESLIVTP